MGWGITKFNASSCSHCELHNYDTLIWHTGGLSGLTAIIVIEPVNEIVVVWLTNGGPPNIAIINESFKLVSLFDVKQNSDMK